MPAWYECERIEEIDDFVEKHLTEKDYNNYLSTFTDEYEDWKPTIARWIEDKITALESLQELIDDLPEELEEEE